MAKHQVTSTPTHSREISGSPQGERPQRHGVHSSPGHRPRAPDQARARGLPAGRPRRMRLALRRATRSGRERGRTGSIRGGGAVSGARASTGSRHVGRTLGGGWGFGWRLSIWSGRAGCGSQATSRRRSDDSPEGAGEPHPPSRRRARCGRASSHGRGPAVAGHAPRGCERTATRCRRGRQHEASPEKMDEFSFPMPFPRLSYLAFQSRFWPPPGGLENRYGPFRSIVGSNSNPSASRPRATVRR